LRLRSCRLGEEGDSKRNSKLLAMGRGNANAERWIQVALALAIKGETTGGIDWRWWQLQRRSLVSGARTTQMRRQHDPDAKDVAAVRAARLSAEK
jgi:hypothetical protein